MDRVISNTALSPTSLVVLCVVIAIAVTWLRSSNSNQPPRLQDKIPYITNTIQYLTDAGRFIDRVKEKLEKANSDIVRFNVGFIPAYVVRGPDNLLLMDKHWGMHHHEIAKFANDKTGRGKAPAPGTETVPESERYWLGHDRLYVNYLANRQNSDALADVFHRTFLQQLNSLSEEWSTINLFETLKTLMATSAITSLFGTRIFDLNPDLINVYWQFDDIAGHLVWGLPKFLQRRSVATKDRLHSMTLKYVNSAWENFDWDSSESESPWDPHFGSRLCRETAKWFRENNFSNHAAAGHAVGALFGLNGNTIPITTWIMMHAIQDPVLFEALRKEALSVYEDDPLTGERHVNTQKLINLPLMQSVYVEAMRVHVSFNVTRQASQPLAIGGYAIEKGALVQACSKIAHFEESTWGVEGHPASEFWAWRHIKSVASVDSATGKAVHQDQFAMKGRPSSFFPYGAGYVMCPGRFFAKQEILLAVAILVANFDIEFEQWIKEDGSDSDRPAQDDGRYAAFIAMHPDREMVMDELKVLKIPGAVYVLAGACVLVYFIYQRAYPRPLAGIPYNKHALKRFAGDLPEIQERQKDGASIRPWFLEQAGKHQSAIMQIFLGPFASPAILISDFREASDILMHREADFKRGKKVDVFKGVLPHAHPAMETWDPRFKNTRDLVRDVMTPSFLHSVSAPKVREVSIKLAELWKLKSRFATGRPFDVAENIVEFSFDAILSAATGLGPSGGDVNQQVLHLAEVLKEKPLESSVDIHRPIEVPALDRSTKLKSLVTDEETLWKGFYMPWPGLYHMVNGLRPQVKDARRVLRNYINSQITDAIPRLQTDGKPECALDYVIQREIKAALKEGRAPVLDDPRIRDQIYGYLIAGHDTSAGTLSWIIRRLMANPEEQVKLRSSLRETYRAAWDEKRIPTAQELTSHAPYLDAFLEEVLRYNCPVVTIMIVARRDTIILGHAVPEDTPVFLNLTGASMSRPSVPVDESLRSKSSKSYKPARENWDDMDPEMFYPERWLVEDQDGKKSFSASAGPTLAFSAGNRGCWGKRLGYLELRVVLSILIWVFNFEEVPEEIVNWDTYDSLVTAPKECFVRLTEAYSGAI
ncbi:hypothetical protein FAUST_9712 [Fusarium austroamericanum]|uniref:Cytochrome P450 n=1 Tax=Fusarium austroamericanum TaxID=282268 RepID=A0AAN6BWE0_FUSAU|nr:hypothetical protein FAUST_9712 [Fusarium austroamericanum]